VTAALLDKPSRPHDVAEVLESRLAEAREIAKQWAGQHADTLAPVRR
jgi:hypothetical protein